MKTGRSIQELAAEIERQAATKQDMIASTDDIQAVVHHSLSRDGVALTFGNHSLPVNKFANGQISTYLNIPSKHYDRLMERNPSLLAEEINFFLSDRRTPEKRMIRTLDNNVRAFLSDRYRRLDNFDMLTAVLPVIFENRDLQIASCEVTDTRLYLKVLRPSLEAAIKVGDPVQAGFVISNSEVGQGAIYVSPFLLRLACLNGMKIDEFAQRRNHIGRASVAESDAYSIYSDKTLQLEDDAFWAKIVDTVRVCLDESRVNEVFGKLRESTERRITGNPESVVTVLANKHGLNKSQSGSVLRNLIDGGMGLNQWALSNAITSVANDTEDYDEATRLEGIGGKIATLAAGEWKTLSSVTSAKEQDLVVA